MFFCHRKEQLSILGELWERDLWGLRTQRAGLRGINSQIQVL
jgi:hypothetical protein